MAHRSIRAFEELTTDTIGNESQQKEGSYCAGVINSYSAAFFFHFFKSCIANDIIVLKEVPG